MLVYARQPERILMRKVRACEEREGEVGVSIQLRDAAGGGEGIQLVQIEGARHTSPL